VLVSTATHAAKHTNTVRLIGAISPDFHRVWGKNYISLSTGS